MTPRLLVIAGSDCSAGAGLQADLKTAQHFGVYAQTVVTAVTVQNTQRVSDVHFVPAATIRAQIEACLSDIGADAIKIGMLGNGEIAAAVSDALDGLAIPVVLDTVLVSSSGAPLLDEDGLRILKYRLLPMAALVTPNADEAEMLVGVRPRSDHSIRNAVQAFSALCAAPILFKGGHVASGETVRDTLASGGVLRVFESARQEGTHLHGTGCTLATAIACGLAKGAALAQAVADAHAYVQDAIRTAPGLGRGSGPLNHSVEK